MRDCDTFASFDYAFIELNIPIIIWVLIHRSLHKYWTDPAGENYIDYYKEYTDSSCVTEHWMKHFW